MNILIADDDGDFVRALKSILEKKGHLVQTAFDGKGALELISKQEYDIVFIDHDMPELTGIEVVKLAKKENPFLNIVMVTGYLVMKENFAKHFGADEYLQKPVSIERIEEILKKFSRKETKDEG